MATRLYVGVIQLILIRSWVLEWKPLRINARLDDERTAKLLELQSSTRCSASDVLKLAIDCLHKEHRALCRKNIQNLLSSDFIGCADGPEDLAEAYKQYLSDDLGHKHGAG